MTKWKEGVSGNPHGRPKGSLSQSTKVRELLQSRSVELVETVVKLALSGDLTALKMCLDRICPPMKAQAAPVAIKLPVKGDMTQIAETLVRAAADGRLPPDIASQMVAAVGQLARITQVSEHLCSTEEEGEPITEIRIRLMDENGEIRDISPSNRKESKNSDAACTEGA